MHLQKLKSFKFGSWNLILFLTRYRQNDRIAIITQTDEGEPYATVSTNIPDAELEENEFCVPDYKLPKELLEALLGLGLFEEVEDKMISSGFIMAPVWRITDPSVLANVN